MGNSSFLWLLGLPCVLTASQGNPGRPSSRRVPLSFVAKLDRVVSISDASERRGRPSLMGKRQPPIGGLLQDNALPVKPSAPTVHWAMRWAASRHWKTEAAKDSQWWGRRERHLLDPGEYQPLLLWQCICARLGSCCGFKAALGAARSLIFSGRCGGQLRTEAAWAPAQRFMFGGG